MSTRAHYEQFRGHECFAEGQNAAANGLNFISGCPYAFSNSGMTLEEFDASGQRGRLRAWFAGWYCWKLDQAGDGNHA